MSEHEELDPEAGRGTLERWVPLVAWLRESGPRVGAVSATWPDLGWPPLERDLAVSLCTSALVIAVITFVTGVAISRSLADRKDQVRPGREMAALGAANLASGLSGGYPVGASFSRSSVAAEAGARTPLATAVAATKQQVEGRLRIVGFFDRLGDENVYLRVEDAIEDLESRCS